MNNEFLYHSDGFQIDGHHAEFMLDDSLRLYCCWHDEIPGTVTDAGMIDYLDYRDYFLQQVSNDLKRVIEVEDIFGNVKITPEYLRLVK